MKTVYTLTVRPSVKIPAGNLRLDVGGERTFLFRTIEDRQLVLDWVRAKDWPHSTSIDHIMDNQEARTEILADIKRTCEYFHHPLPKGLEE